MKTFNEILTENELLVEASLSRLLRHTKDTNLGIISAHRSLPPESTEDEHAEQATRNAKHTAELRNHIEKAGFGYHKLQGRYIENYGEENARPVDEHSFLVIGKKGNDKGKLEDFLKKHGKGYKQDSVLYKPHHTAVAHLEGTNKTSDFPGYGNQVELGEFRPDRVGQFYSTMKRGKSAFLFSGEGDKSSKKGTISGKRDEQPEGPHQFGIKTPDHRPIRVGKDLELRKDIKVESLQIIRAGVSKTFLNRTGTADTVILECKIP